MICIDMYVIGYLIYSIISSFTIEKHVVLSRVCCTFRRRFVACRTASCAWDS